MNRTIPIIPILPVAHPPHAAATHANPASLIHTEHLRCAVPVAYGGSGGTAQDLEPLMSQLCAESMSAALLFWCQRMAIEFLVQSGNGAIREYLLPDLLSQARAATVPFALDVSPLSAHDTGRGWVLNGDVALAGNAQADGFSLISPLQPEDGRGGWVVLRSEEDGFHVRPHHISPDLSEARTARILVQNVFFREDEWLGDTSLLQAVSPVRMALGVIYETLLSQVEPI